MAYIPKQGDIVYVNFNPQAGHEQARTRPALVVSKDIFNQFTRKAAILCPITNTDRGLPFQVKLDERTKTTGVILCDQVKSLDISARNISFKEHIPEDILEEVIDILIGFIEV